MKKVKARSKYVCLLCEASFSTKGACEIHMKYLFFHYLSSLYKKHKKIFNSIMCAFLLTAFIICIYEFYPVNEHFSSNCPECIESYHNFLTEIPEWNDPTSYICIRDDKHYKFPPEVILRFRDQREEGNCFGHAGIGDQYYLACRFNESAEMIDMKDAYHQVFNKWTNRFNFNAGGDSLTFLKAILLRGSSTFSPGLNLINESLFRDFGTALISRFIVEDKFHGDGKKYSGNYVYKRGLFCSVFGGILPDRICRVPSHAMIIIGIRTDSHGKKHFLVQNSWKEKRFVDIDYDYMESSNATITFITTPQNIFNNKFQTVKSKSVDMDFQAGDNDYERDVI